MRFSLTFLLVTVIVPSLAQTLPQLERNITDISRKVATFDTSINSFPATGGSIGGALAIHTAAKALKSTFDLATISAKTTPDAELAGSIGEWSMLTYTVNMFVPTIEHGLTGIVAKKPAFDALPSPLSNASDLFKQDLAILRNCTRDFCNALVHLAPEHSTSLASQAITIRDRIDGLFRTAQTSYP